jgi:L-ascorbate metabolism protein UlaG (beta-lactamase superfamily)
MNLKTMVRRISWAGVALESEGKTLVIDGIEGRTAEFAGRLGRPRLPLLPLAEGGVDFAIVTHLHKDHFDEEALKRRLGATGVLYVPEAAAGELTGTTLRVIPVRDRVAVQAGPFRLTPVPAVDGFGAPQSSWVIEAGGVRIFHGGDTLFHGYWWEIAKIAGGLDVAFLPINGARIAIPGLEATGLPGVMNAEQAAVAARLLKAKVAVPIHYQEFHNPPIYDADLDAETNFIRHAAREKVIPQIVAAGQEVRLGG